MRNIGVRAVPKTRPTRSWRPRDRTPATPRRRSFGYVFRRRRKITDASGKVHREYVHGFYVRFRVGGREVVRFAGADRDIAVAYAQRLTRETDRRDLLGEQPRSDMKFEDFADKYLDFAKQSMTNASYESRRRLVRGVVVPFFKGRLLDEIETPEVQRFLASRADVAGATRNRALTALSAIFRRAIDLALVTKNPAREVRRSKESRLPLTLVPDAQVAALLGHLGEPQRTFFSLLVESGLRLSEALRLEWPDVDFDEATHGRRACATRRDSHPRGPAGRLPAHRRGTRDRSAADDGRLDGLALRCSTGRRDRGPVQGRRRGRCVPI